MDEAIPKRIIARKRLKGYGVALLVVGLLSTAFWVLRASFANTIKKSAISTAVVERGDVDNTLNASGEVIPEFEEVITCPITASIQKVLLDAGSHIEPGQSVLVLDKSSSELDYEKLKYQLESKRNNIHKLKLELDKSFFDLQANNDIKQLRINSLEASVENTKKLFKAGGGTREDIEQAELNLKVAMLEKRQLENEILSKQQTMQAEMKESEIAAEIQLNDLQVLERKLKLANIVASRAGVVTWVNKNIGSAVREGDPIARIADLGSYKISGSISDSYIDQLRTGMAAIIRINETLLRGTVVNISPSVQNGIVSFEIQPEERNSKQLRPNMKVEAFLVTARHPNTLRISNGAAFKGSPVQDIFVLKKDRAYRRTVHIGMTNFDYVEITDNVQPGEVVITSDMSEYKNATEIIITN